MRAWPRVRAPGLAGAVMLALVTTLGSCPEVAFAEEAPVPGAPGTAAPGDLGTVALFPFEGFDLPADVESVPLELGGKVGERMREVGYTVSEPTLLLRDMLIAVDCDGFDGPCARKIGRNLGVDFVVVGKVVLGAEGDVRARIRRWRTRDGALLADINEVVPLSMELARERYGALADLALRASFGGGDGGARKRLTLPRLMGPGVAAAGAGGLFLVAALATGVASGTERRASDRAPMKTLEDFEIAVRHRNRSRTLRTASGIFVGIGTAVAAAGVTMIILDRIGARDRRATGLPSVVVVPLGDGAVVVVGW